MDDLPPDFRYKYEELKTVIDPISQKPISDCLRSPYWGFESYPTGARRFNFEKGDIASFDHTNRYPIVCIYGPIFQFYASIGGPGSSALGRPLTDVRDLPDGSRCAVFEGGHVHQWGDKAEPFPASHCTASWQPPPPPFPFGIGPNKLPLPFLQKWMDMSYQHDPITQKCIAECLGPIFSEPANIETGGQVVRFNLGYIVIFDNFASVVYGPISDLWTKVDGGWGRPLTDEQDLGDGGRCVVFEGGHIHRYGDEARPVRAEMCTARNKPTPRPGVSFNKMPPYVQWKWSELLYVNLPTMQPVALALGGVYGSSTEDFSEGVGGQYFRFYEGCLVTLTKGPAPPPPNTPLELIQPFAVYGAIYHFWRDAGFDKSLYGRPICDEQQLPDGSRCGIFEGGHIHVYNGVAKEFPARDCLAKYKPQPPPRRSNVPSIPAIAPSFSQPLGGYYPSPTQPDPAYSSPSQSYSTPSQSHSGPSPGAMLSTASHVAHSFSQPLHSLQHHLSEQSSQSQSQSQSYTPQPPMTTNMQPSLPTLPDFGQSQYNPGNPMYSSGPAPFMVSNSNANANANTDGSLVKPVGVLALFVFGLIGWNMEKDCDGCCCCC